MSILRLSDDGPGVPEKARKQPVPAVRRLGCAAAARAWAWPSPANWPRATAATWRCVETGPGGSAFDLTLAGTPEPLPEEVQPKGEVEALKPSPMGRGGHCGAMGG